MDALLILILAITAATGLAWAALSLHEFITGDGYGSRTHEPPRSHPHDQFDRSPLPR
ncbi:MAG: hypothetical protein ACRDPB_11130 [Nocardioidaceae bacterium]